MTIEAQWQKYHRVSREIGCRTLKQHAYLFFHQSKNFLLPVSLSLLVSLLLPLNVCALTVPEWKVTSREAFVLQNDLQFAPAYNKYKEALRQLGDSDNENTREIKLNMAAMLRLSGQPGKALELLQTLSSCFNTNKPTLQSMRYWRRLRDVYRDLNDGAHALDAQRKVFAITKQYFEAGSPIYLNEMRVLIDLLGQNSQLQEATEYCTQMHRFIRRYSASSKEQFENAIDAIESKSRKAAQDFQAAGKLKESLDMLHRIRPFAPSDQYLQDLKYLESDPMPFDPKLKKQIQLEIQQSWSPPTLRRSGQE